MTDRQQEQLAAGAWWFWWVAGAAFCAYGAWQMVNAVLRIASRA